MILRMLWRSVSEGRQRKLLAGATVALAAALVGTLLALSVDVGDKMAREMTSYGANIRVTPKAEAVGLLIGGVDFNPLKGRETLREEDLPRIKDIFWRNNIIGLVPRLALPVRLAAGGRSVPAALVGTYFDRRVPLPDDDGFRTGLRQVHRLWQVEGAWPGDDDAGQVLLGRRLAEALRLSVGRTLTVEPASRAAGGPLTLTVAGILHTGGPEDETALVPLVAAQGLAGMAGRIQSVEVSALTVPENDLSRKARRGVEGLSSAEYDVWYCTAYVSSISHQIEEAVPDASARPIWQVAASEGVVVERIQTLLAVISAAAIAAAAMCVSALMNATVMERAKEIGLMKALGAAPWQIHLLFVGEAAIVGLAGGALGLLAGYGLVQAVGWHIFAAGVEFRPVILPVVLVMSVAVVLAGSVVPARSIAALLPIEVLRGRR